MSKLMPFVLPDGQLVTLAVGEDEPVRPSDVVTTFQLHGGEVVYALRGDCVGELPPVITDLLEQFGKVSKPPFAVRVCARCKAIQGVKTVTNPENTVTHGICRGCLKRDFPGHAERVLNDLTTSFNREGRPVKMFVPTKEER